MAIGGARFNGPWSRSTKPRCRAGLRFRNSGVCEPRDSECSGSARAAMAALAPQGTAGLKGRYVLLIINITNRAGRGILRAGWYVLLQFQI